MFSSSKISICIAPHAISEPHIAWHHTLSQYSALLSTIRDLSTAHCISPYAISAPPQRPGVRPRHKSARERMRGEQDRGCERNREDERREQQRG
eukprot:1657975-Rhodomonas_salina.3